MMADSSIDEHLEAAIHHALGIERHVLGIAHAGDDLNIKMGVPFPRQMKIKSGETVVFAYILFKSRTHRDRVNAKVMKDPRIAGMGDPKNMPFDPKRMMYGGFKVFVDA